MTRRRRDRRLPGVPTHPAATAQGWLRSLAAGVGVLALAVAAGFALVLVGGWLVRVAAWGVDHL